MTTAAGIDKVPRLDADLVVRALAIALSQTLDDAGRSGFVMGLSGGVDSALAAAIALRAAGPGAVHAFHLPAGTAITDSAEIAREMADHLGIDLKTIPVGPLVDGAPLATSEARGRGNFTSRIRMALLYDRAAALDALVLGTSNKSEIALGYTTLWGDMAADCWPLGDLYKTQVLDVARSIGLPAAVVERTPSAELWDGQTDEGELGFSYSQADLVLYAYLEGRRRPEEIAGSGIDADVVERVLDRVQRNAFKRRLPWIPKLTTRTVGHDFLHPRAWRGPA
ncbi:MAG TPA: NAD+ synthase [Gemmatimonadota bacterium]|nr:NAD+ synthase [Gemmatimonadota bacterium]